MLQNTPHFRPAHPTDAETAARLLYSSGPQFYDYVFSTDRAQVYTFLRHMFVAGSHMFGYQRYTVATIDEQVVAIGAFHAGTQMPGVDSIMAWQAIRCFGIAALPGIALRGLKLRPYASHADSTTEIFASVAVVEAWQGQGIGTALLQRQIEVARQKGRKRCRLNVAISNPGAQRLYERLGFQVVEERRVRGIGSVMELPDLRYMELVL